jgi:hypothetical protein
MIPRRTFRPAPQPVKPFLYPRGTLMADVPPLHRGLTDMQYLDHCIAVSKKEAALAPEPEAPPVVTPAFGTRRLVR